MARCTAPPSPSSGPSVMIFGIGSFAHGFMRCLREDQASVSAYLMRSYGHYGPRLEGPGYDAADHADPLKPLAEQRADFVVPMSIDWAMKPWASRFLGSGVPILCPVGEGLLLERDRDFARRLCHRHRIPFPKGRRFASRRAAREWLRRHPQPYVIKNPLCAPLSPVHTIVCESAAETRAWLERIDDSEGVFLQEYLGRAEAGHIALVSDGEIHPLVTNQEYKRAHDGNQGIVAGAPLGGLVERDPNDRYGLVRELIEPLKPWFQKVGFRGPVQVTAIRHDNRWSVLEYNVRLGVTSGVMILRLLENPAQVLFDAAHDRPLSIRWRKERRYGCSITLAGWGYPYVSLEGPRLPVVIREEPDCDVWWNEVAVERGGSRVMTGHRIADVAAVAGSLRAAIRSAYRNIARIHCLGSYYRLDVGRSLWPPGTS